MSGRDKYPGLSKRWPARTIEERFRDFISPEPTSGCFLWTGAVHHETGYGVFGTAPREVEQAHRFAFFLKHGRYPRPGFEVCHKCDVRTCVRDDHLFEGTRSDNMKDAARKGRVVIPNAKLTRTRAILIGLRAQFERNGALAREYGIAPSAVTKCKHGWVPRFGPETRKVGHNLKEV